MDLKFLGYSISTVSVLLLGIAAWPATGQPTWTIWLILAGMALSIAGMFVRYLSHRQDQRDIERAAHDQEPLRD